jgi:hypothetical protein
MTTNSPDKNGCIPDRVMISVSGSSPFRGNFRYRDTDKHIEILNSGFLATKS